MGPFNFFKSLSVYRIETNDEGSMSLVERCSDDFSQLWRILKEIYPAQVIPPLPSHSIISAALARKNEVLVRERESALRNCLEALLDHFVLREDEYLRAFLTMDRFAESVPLIKNTEPPIQLKRDYFKWSISRKMAKDHQYLKIVKGVQVLTAFKDKLKALQPLLDRIIYERRESSNAAFAAQMSIRQLMLLNKSKQIFASDSDKVCSFLDALEVEEDDGSTDILYFIVFAAKYIDSTENLIDRVNRFRSFVSGKRDQVSLLATKLDQIQMPHQAKPSFDLIFKTKTRHERLLEEMAVIEVTYEKYAELVEKELDWIREWLDLKFKSKLSKIFKELIINS